MTQNRTIQTPSLSFEDVAGHVLDHRSLVAKQLPPDVDVVDVIVDRESRTIRFLLGHSTFDLVPRGCKAPEVTR